MNTLKNLLAQLHESKADSIYNTSVEPTSSYIPYETYCGLLDYIGENYNNLNEETLVEDWWSDLSPDEQSKYKRDHPNSQKAKDAREKEDGDKKKPSLKDKAKGLFSKEKTQAALKDLKSHVDGVVKSVGVDAKLVTKAFKEPSVYNTVNALGGSVSAAAKSVQGMARGVGKTLDIGGAVVSDTSAFKQLEKGVIKVDEFMDKHPTLKKVGGAAVAGIATYQWLKMSFSGDIESDYDVSLITGGLAGTVGFADLINTPSGVKSMALLGAGLATGGLPIWMAGKAGLGLALAYTGLKQAGETEAGKKVKSKMIDLAKKGKEKIQKGAKAADTKLGVKSEEFKQMNTLKNLLDQLNEGKAASIYNTKPETLKDAEDPEVIVQGYGRMRYSQLGKRITEQLEDFAVLAKRGQWSGIEKNMRFHHTLLTGIQEIEKEMSSSDWKRKTTKLKRAGK